MERHKLEIPSHPGGHIVYFLWLGTKLVYIGYTKNWANRCSAHKRDGKEFDAATCEIYDSRRQAMNREAQLIREYTPPLNKQSLGRKKRQRTRLSDLGLSLSGRRKPQNPHAWLEQYSSEENILAQAEIPGDE